VVLDTKMIYKFENKSEKMGFLSKKLQKRVGHPEILGKVEIFNTPVFSSFITTVIV
jgi:hypothetical protein